MVERLQMPSLTALTETWKMPSSHRELHYFQASLAENGQFEGILPQTNCDMQHNQKNEASD